jgi:hypothetical protein
MSKKFIGIHLWTRTVQSIKLPDNCDAIPRRRCFSLHPHVYAYCGLTNVLWNAYWTLSWDKLLWPQPAAYSEGAWGSTNALCEFMLWGLDTEVTLYLQNLYYCHSHFFTHTNSHWYYRCSFRAKLHVSTVYIHLHVDAYFGSHWKWLKIIQVGSVR